MKGLVSIAGSIAALFVLANATSAGQQADVKKKIPRLTTEDVLREKPTQVLSEPLPETKDSKAGGKVEAAPAADKGQRSTDASPEELTWREALKQARERARAAQRSAEEAELRTNDLRNQLGVSGKSTAFRNQTAAELDEAGQTVKQRKAEAREASDELNALLEEGSGKGYKEDAGPKAVTQEGKPNEDYYRSRFAELSGALEDAARRIQLGENRLREYNFQITNNTKTGDNFYLAQLQQERDEAQRSLNEAVTAREKAAGEIESLKEQARSAGVAPGVFR